MPSLQRIKADLESFQGEWIVLYGSFVTGRYNPRRSDIDVALLTRSSEKVTNIAAWQVALGKCPPPYDVRVFELFPLFLQAEVIQGYQVVFRNSLDISEYFYQFRKIWRDIEGRVKVNQFRNAREKLQVITNNKILKERSSSRFPLRHLV